MRPDATSSFLGGQRQAVGELSFIAPSDEPTINLTPIIDIVFLLIIFFLVVCRFIEAENFPVAVPDRCESAQSLEHPGQVVTVTVMPAGADEIEFAVGSVPLPPSDSSELVEQMTQLLDASLAALPAERRVVTLRIDKNVSFAQAQYALAAVAASSATDIQIATIRNQRQDLR